MNSYDASNNPEKLAKRVGDTLRKTRRERTLTLEELAGLTEVSKLTLGNIERGEANPSLSVIWKIANGLEIPISSLINEQPEVTISRKHEGNKVISANGTCTLEPVFDTSSFGSLEIHRAFLKPYSEYSPGAHQAGVIEYLTVMTGEVIIELQNEVQHLHEYDSIKFYGDSPHTYKNPSPKTAVLHFVMTYSRAD